MYKYDYVTVRLGFFRGGTEEIEQIINERALQGYRFVTTIPADYGNYGRISKLTLVFEKEV